MVVKPVYAVRSFVVCVHFHVCLSESIKYVIYKFKIRHCADSPFNFAFCSLCILHTILLFIFPSLQCINIHIETLKTKSGNFLNFIHITHCLQCHFSLSYYIPYCLSFIKNVKFSICFVLVSGMHQFLDSCVFLSLWLASELLVIPKCSAQ